MDFGPIPAEFCPRAPRATQQASQQAQAASQFTDDVIAKAMTALQMETADMHDQDFINFLTASATQHLTQSREAALAADF